MNSFKLLVIFFLLFFGIFAQRFQRHLFDATKNGYIYGNTKMDNLDALSSDEENHVQDGDDVKFVGDEREGVELELKYNELKFRFCSDGCMGKKVIVCYDCDNTDEVLQGDCDLNQCDFRAGVLKETAGTIARRLNLLWFISSGYSRPFGENDKICESIVMKSPEAKVTFQTSTPIKSCDPKKYDGKVIKLSVRGVKYGCPLYVLNAKKWTPPLTTLPTSQNSSKITQTTEKSSNGETTLWIGIGVAFFILLIVLIGFGYCYYRTEIQKKPLFGKKKELQQKAFIPEASKKANVVEKKTEDEKDVVVAKPKPSKEATKKEIAKQKQPKPTKKKIPRKKAIVEAKPSKEITQENGTNEDAPLNKFSTEPTLEDATTEASIVQKSIVQQKLPENPSSVFNSNKVILPSMNSDKFKSVSLFDTLSGAEDDETQHSKHASEKPRKNESAKRKKGSKKHR